MSKLTLPCSCCPEATKEKDLPLGSIEEELAAMDVATEACKASLNKSGKIDMALLDAALAQADRMVAAHKKLWPR
jgi:hypothetical protein